MIMTIYVCMNFVLKFLLALSERLVINVFVYIAHVCLVFRDLTVEFLCPYKYKIEMTLINSRTNQIFVLEHFCNQFITVFEHKI